MPPLRKKVTSSTVGRVPYKRGPQRDTTVTGDTTELEENDNPRPSPVTSGVSQAEDSSHPLTLIQGNQGPGIPQATYEYGLGNSYKWNCNQVRKKIQNLIQSGEIKVTHFQKAIGIYSSDYHRFMKMTGPMQGCDNVTYSAACQFFLSRERAGVQEAKPVKATAADLDKFNVDGMELEGECDGQVPVYDTCDDIRKKIQAHLREPGVTQAAFCREIAKTYRNYLDPNKTIQSVQLKNFLSQRGARSGNMSAVYYASYVYFEKLRIKNGVRKTKKRIEVEAEHWDDSTLYMDDLGRMFARRTR